MNKYNITFIVIILALIGCLVYLNITINQTVKLSNKYEETMQKNHIEHLILESNGGVVPEQIDII